jgi:topoisomerase-4 subunit A
LKFYILPKITDWGVYDGRRAEPNNLPVKFPLLLAQGAQRNRAVGLSTKVLPHNFNELIDASIKILRKTIYLVPDFMTQGIADVSNYNDGMRGGRVRAC